VEKYVMADEEYNKRDNTYRKYKEERIKADPTWTLEKEMCMRSGKKFLGSCSGRCAKCMPACALAIARTFCAKKVKRT
jgi:hypothetical protein